MIKLENVVYEEGKYWIYQVPTGYEVYEIGATCSTRFAQIGFTGEKGLEIAMHYLNKRKNQQN